MLGFGSKQKKFWKWFEKNSDKIFNFEKDPGKVFELLKKKLKSVNKDLTFEFSPILENGKREFVISADGIFSSFADVIDLVDEAPDLPNWEIVSFRQRKSIKDTVLKINEIELATENMFFLYELEGDNRLSLNIYIKNLDQSKIKTYIQAAFILLDCALGEFDVETKIARIDIQKLDDDGQIEKLYKFEEIAEIFDEFYKDREVEEE
jgi:hypothetical protein